MSDKFKDMSKEELQAILIKLLESKEPEQSEKKRKNRNQVRFEKNTFVDDGTLCSEDKKFTKDVKFNVSERRQVDNTLRTCEDCKTEFNGIATDKYCNDCILMKSGKK